MRSQLTSVLRTTPTIIGSTPIGSLGYGRRCLWGWLYSVFNRVDKDRVKLVGPERACAEWLLKSGAKVQWKGRGHWVTDYNTLPQGHYNHVIEGIDATDAPIMDIGFEHLRGLKDLQSLTLHQCLYISDSALSKLPLVSHSLQHLQISSCPGITDTGLYELSQLRNLRTLLIFNLPLVKNMECVVETIQKTLPDCDLQLTKKTPVRPITPEHKVQ